MCSTPASMRSLTSTPSAGTRGAIRTRSSTRRAISRSTRTSRPAASIRSTTITRSAGSEGRDPSAGLRHHALPDPQSGCGGGRRRSARALSRSSAWPKAAQAYRGDRAEHRQRLRRAILPAAQSGRGGGRRRSAAALQHVRLARRPQSERLVRHRRLSRALRRRGGGGRQPARSTTSSSAGRKAAIRRPRFDTLGYLAANPDVAAADVNPLDHFLTFGIYEGRQIVNDGLFR